MNRVSHRLYENASVPHRSQGSVFFPEACSVDVSFRRVCKHAARLRAAPEVEYVSTSTSGRVRHFRRVCMPASTCEFGGGGMYFSLAVDAGEYAHQSSMGSFWGFVCAFFDL